MHCAVLLRKRMLAVLVLAVAAPALAQITIPFPHKPKPPAVPKVPGAPGAAPAAPVVPDVILRNGHIYTANPLAPWVEAVAIVGDHVQAVGADAKITATADKHTQVIDLQGRMAMPGINDSHDHVGGAPYGLEVKTKRPPQADPPLSEVMDALRIAVSDAKPGEWIHAVVGATVMKQVKAARAEIDSAGGSHPVILEAWWGHGVILNEVALGKLGIDDKVKDPQGGHYDRDSSGHLTGRLEEYAANAVKQRLGGQGGVPASVAEFKAYAARRLQEGVTSVQVMATNDKLTALEETFKTAQTPLRIRIMRFPIPGEDAGTDQPLATAEETITPLVRVFGVKWVLDGTPIDELAYMTKDYADQPGWRGRSNFSEEFIRAQLSQAMNSKDQLMMHIVGDAMTDEVLDLMEKLGPPEKWRFLRVRFEHGEGLNTPERIARARKLGIVIAQPRPGAPWKSWVEGAIPLAYGSDGGMAPFFMFAAMTAAGDQKAMTRVQALDVLTHGSAYAEFEDTRKGSLAPGMLADIAVLSQDVTTAGAEKLAGTKSVLTMVAGKVAYSSAEMGGS